MLVVLGFLAVVFCAVGLAGCVTEGISIYAGARQRSFGEALGLRGGAARAATAQGADGDRREH
ncbi:hypothetical protein [Mycobacterium shottsii]|uniref:hypothetical protein n=1 Tax=Mycobacterium shottsii TaxID=133549 RepID=UPI0018E9E4C2|nr:hypothetical protein [Mycobacterium shottsii]